MLRDGGIGIAALAALAVAGAPSCNTSRSPWAGGTGGGGTGSGGAGRAGGTGGGDAPISDGQAPNDGPSDGGPDAPPKTDGSPDATRPGIASQPLCPADGWCWENPLPQGNDLYGVWGTATDDVWAVGDSGTILHWDGKLWSPVQSGVLEPLNGVWAASPGEAWVSGRLNALLRWDGAHWAPAQQPARFTEAEGVTGWVDPSAGGAATVWYAADANPLTFSGGAWTYGGTPPNPSFSIYALWANASGALWAAGTSGSIAVRTGKTWSSTLQAGGLATLRGLTGDPQGYVWAVGDSGTIVRVDPRGVAAPLSSGTTSNLAGVWASSFDDAWIAGDGGTLLHFDGAAWRPWASGTTFNLRAIWGAARDDVWAVGDHGTIIHFDGVAWSRPNGEMATNLNAAWGATLDDVWAVGVGGLVLRRQGAAWRSWPSPTTEELTSIWGSAADDVWVGGYKVLLHWDGTQLATATTAGASDALALSGRARDDVWAISGARIRHWDGSGWTSPNDPPQPVTGSIFQADHDDVWVSSMNNEATAGHWTSQGWTRWPLSSCFWLHGSGPSDVWCVGGSVGPSCVHWDGSAWHGVTIPADTALDAVASSGPGRMWYSGQAGVLGSCDGTTCTGRALNGDFAHRAFVGEDLKGIAVVGDDVFIVGTRGTILHRHP